MILKFENLNPGFSTDPFHIYYVYPDQYNRIYSPVTFGKKYDPKGDYIRHFLPVLKGKVELPQFHQVIYSFSPG